MGKNPIYTFTSLLLLITGLVFLSTAIPTSATDAPSASDSADASVTVGEACSMTGSGMSSHSAEIPNGTYQDEIGTTTIKITCNDSAGFSVYAVGYTGDAIGEANSTKLVGRSTNSLISTSTATSGDNSAWAMKVGTNGSATYPVSLQNGFGSYSAVPASYTKVATRTAGTDVGTEATGSTITTTYASFISRTQPADTYDGKVKYTLVHPSDAEAPLSPQQATAGCINYFANASSAVGTMGCQSASDGNTITLLASNFSRTGYGFAGWSDKYDYATNLSAKFYGPQENITVPEGTTTNGLSLYAVWVKSEGNLQDTSNVTALCGTNGTGGSLITASTDGTANLSSVSALTDQRDNNTYAIAKLADGKCWMIENLRLESTNSDNTTGALAQSYGTSTTYGNFGGLADAESTGFSSTYTANSLYYSGTQSGSASINIGTTSNPGYRMPRYNNLNTQNRATNPTSNTFANNNTTGGMYSYGNYYTWHAAIADLTYNGTNNQSTTGTSLCPKGWHLPEGGSSANASNSEFWQYGLAIMGNAPSNNSYYQSSETNINGDIAAKVLRKYPNNFLYSGGFSTSSIYSRGSLGYYWSSTAGSDYVGYNLNLDNSKVYPGTGNNNKYYGRSIRCTAGS